MDSSATTTGRRRGWRDDAVLAFPFGRIP